MVHLYFSECVELIEDGDKLWINTKDGCILRIQGLSSANCVHTSGVNEQEHYMMDLKIFPKKEPSQELQETRARLEECHAAWEQLCPCVELRKLKGESGDLDEDTLEEAIARGKDPAQLISFKQEKGDYRPVNWVEVVQEMLKCPDCGTPIPKERVEGLHWHCPNCGWD